MVSILSGSTQSSMQGSGWERITISAGTPAPPQIINKKLHYLAPVAWFPTLFRSLFSKTNNQDWNFWVSVLSFLGAKRNREPGSRCFCKSYRSFKRLFLWHHKTYRHVWPSKITTLLSSLCVYLWLVYFCSMKSSNSSSKSVFFLDLELITQTTLAASSILQLPGAVLLWYAN